MRYRYLDDFRRGISVFAIFSYGIAVLGTPQCPPQRLRTESLPQSSLGPVRPLALFAVPVPSFNLELIYFGVFVFGAKCILLSRFFWFLLPVVLM